MSGIDLPPAVRLVLEGAGHEAEPPQSRRIFTNRDLDLDKIECIGFDMDYTLARYLPGPLDALSRTITLEKLVARGYPASLRALESDPAFAIRGLVVDRTLGNLLKMDRHGYVGRAYHGRRPLSSDERKGIYRAQRIGQERERFAYVDTLFSLPEVNIFAALVDMIDAQPEIWGGNPPDYSRAWADVREAIDEAHQDESIKSRIKSDPAAYIARDPELGSTLHKLRSAGKRLFLLTNSYYPYSNAVMSYLLDDALDAYEDWTVYFDWVVVGSTKPTFFTESRPFQEVDREGEDVGKPRMDVQKGKSYSGGNQQGLQQALGVEPDAVLYVGDHIYGDVVKSKKSSGWRTVLVVEELESELAVREDFSVAINEIEVLSELRDELTESISVQRHLQRGLSRIDAAQLQEPSGLDAADASELLERSTTAARQRFDRLRAHQTEIGETLARRSSQVDAAFNLYWGSVFAERQDASMFGAQLENYACLYTSRVSNFLYVSPARYFHVPHGSMPHWGR